MKRLLSLILTGLMLLSAACTASAPPSIDLPNEPVPDIETDPSDAPAIELPEIEVSDPAEQGGSEPDVTPEPYEATSDASFAFALAAKLLSGKQNRNLSPISVYLAMAMVTEGANGVTQAELLKLLGCETVEDLRGVCGALLKALSIDEEESTLDVHNSLWMAQSIDGQPVTFREAFLGALADTYGSEANTVEFGKLSAAKQIADWITEQTRGKIKVTPDAMNFSPDTLAVLINTIYLKDAWSDPFDVMNTEPDIFTGIGENGEATEIKADFMRRFDQNVTVTQGDGWLRYRVYLRAVGWVSFVLPDEGLDLDRLLGSPEAIEKLLHAGIPKTCNVSLRIPKFSFQDKMELAEVLASLGLEHCFGAEADFSAMSDVPAAISDVLQESFIGVDENGVEAAAYTMITMKATGFFNPVELETVEFHLTRPFFYAIESYDGTLLFVGTVTTPNAAESIHK